DCHQHYTRWHDMPDLTPEELQLIDDFPEVPTQIGFTHEELQSVLASLNGPFEIP
ncbi:hypothetical protein IWQ60_012601, partial [Tieghemiomyces parasiticus]